MAIQVDPTVSPRIITVPQVDLVDGAISVQTLVNQIRNWEDSQANLSYTRLLAASGKEDLGGDVKVGITAKLENAKLKFEAAGSPTVYTVKGGNLVAVDANGVAMDVIEPSTNVTAMVAQSSSATISVADDIRDDLAFIRKIDQGRWAIQSNQMVFYDTDRITPLITFDLKDADGNPTEVNPTERVPV